jgi:hypothetical protein
VTAVSPSDCLDPATLLPLDGFKTKFISENFHKNCGENSSWSKIRRILVSSAKVYVNQFLGSLSLTTVDYLLAAGVYVAYRSSRPNATTVNDVMTELQENDIDVNQLEEWPANFCQ